MARFDRHAAAVEARLDRLEEQAEEAAAQAAAATADEVNGPSDDGGLRTTTGIGDELELLDGMHIETDDDVDLADDDEDDGGHVVVDNAELLDELSEAFNARDLDAVLELCSEDCETPGLATDVDGIGEALDDLWERRPTITLTRGIDDVGQAVGVLWERGETAGWAAVGTLHADVDADGVAMLLEFADDVGILDQLEVEPPDGDLVEGARWEEWDEGAE